MTDVEAPPRERTHQYTEPRGAAHLAGRSGLEVMQALAAGELPAPPISSTLGFELESIESGRAVFLLQPEFFHYNPIGSVHGGVYATLLDSAMGCAVHSTLPEGVGYTSLDLSVKFLRRMTVDTGPVRATGWIVHAGRTTALARAELADEQGRLLADGTSTCLILR
ncbi:hotdog fold thioesterase [Pseudonocardia ailaonensis]|uniref:Hotdog fold thioesterase n=1 Tax=Pseudonocardia ailaonensis TaxID=367279 RepID=A0ABN2NPI8_9PSEU